MAARDEAARRIAALWWDEIPQRIGRTVPAAADALSDGYYLTAWPPVAAVAGPALGALGVIVAVFARWSLDIAQRGQVPGLYSQHLWFVVAAASAGMVSRHLGAWICAGYIVSDAVLHLADPRLGLTRAYADMLLILPCLVLGLRARQLSELVRPLLPAVYQTVVPFRRLGAASAFFVALLWANAFPILVRPTYVWISGSLRIPTSVIRPVQTHVFLIAVVAALAMAVRLVLEPEDARSSTRRRTAAAPWLRTVFPPRAWQTAAAQAAMTTLLLAGMMGGWADAIAFAAFMTLFYGAQAGLAPWLRPPVRLTDRLMRFTPAVRLLMALGGAVAVSWLGLSLMWGHLTTFRPLLVVIAAFLLVFQLLSAVPAPDRDEVPAA